MCGENVLQQTSKSKYISQNCPLTLGLLVLTFKQSTSVMEIKPFNFTNERKLYSLLLLRKDFVVMYQMADIYSIRTTLIASGKLSVLEKYMKLTFKHLVVIV